MSHKRGQKKHSNNRADIKTPTPKITDVNGHLQYIPFPTCNETGRPLELFFGVEKDVNCTLDFVTDEFFHRMPPLPSPRPLDSSQTPTPLQPF